MKRNLFLICIASLVAVLVWQNTRMVTPGDRSRAKWVDIERRSHFPPREYHSSDPAFGLRFWDYFSDPSFSGTDYLEFEFTAEDGTRQDAGNQYIQINKVYNNADFQESLVAIEVGEDVYEFPITEPDYDFSTGFQPAFIGQSQDRVFFAYVTVARPDEKRNLAIISIKLPLSDGGLGFAHISEESNWNDMLARIREIDMDQANLVGLCRHYRDLAKLAFDYDCET